MQRHSLRAIARVAHRPVLRAAYPSLRQSYCTQPPPHFPDPRDPLQSPLADLAVEAQQQKLRRASQQPAPKIYEREVIDGEAFAIGRRKRSEAKIWIREGTGSITVNDRDWIDAFPRIDHRDKIIYPMILANSLGKFDIKCQVRGGGATGQTEAIRHGLSRALQKWDPLLRPTLKKEGLLTRDSRAVEPKKAGRKKARKSFTWVKR